MMTKNDECFFIQQLLYVAVTISASIKAEVKLKEVSDQTRSRSWPNMDKYECVVDR